MTPIGIAAFSTPEPGNARDCSTVIAETSQRILPPVSTLSNEKVHLRVNGIRYEVPGNYFRYPPIGCDTEEGMLLRATYPGLQGATKDTRKWFDEGLNPHMLQILVKGEKNSTMLEGLLGFFQDRFPPPNLTETITEEFGMTHVRRTTDRVYHKPSGNAFYRTEDGKITDFIRCMRRKNGEISTCELIVLLDHAQIQIRFFPKFLPEWQGVQKAGLTLFESFRIQTTDN